MLVAAQPAAVRRYLADFPEHAAMLGLVLVLAWVGGTDTERFLLWASPIVLVMIGIAAGHTQWGQAKWALAILLVSQAVSARWFIATPDHLEGMPRAWPILTPWAAQSSRLLYSQTADRLMGAVALAQHLALSLILLVWFTWRQRPGSQSA